MTGTLDRLRDWAVFAAILVVLWPSLGRDLDKRDVVRIMETNCLVRSQEMWLGIHQAPGAVQGLRAWIVPTQNGVPIVTKPPLLPWLSQVAWIGLEPGTATPQQLVWRARVVAAVLAGLMLAGIYAIGLMVGGRWLGALAVLAAGTMMFFQRQGRTASYDIHLAAWSTLAVAAGMWAMPVNEARPGQGRVITGWILAGLFLAAGWLTKGPLALAWVALPLAGMALVLPGGRWRGLLGLGGAMVLAAAVVAPWYSYVLWQVSTAEETFIREYRAARGETQPSYYYLGLFGLVFPWTLLLAGGLAVPWLDRGQSRGARWAPWLWLAVTFVLFSIPEAKKQRYVLPIVAPAALLIGQFAVYLAGAAAGAAERRTWRDWMMGAHGWMLFGASLGLGVLVSTYRWLPEKLTQAIDLAVAPWWLGVAALIALTAVAWVVLGRVDKRRFEAAAAWTGVWGAGLWAVWWPLYDGRPPQDRVYRESAQRVVQIVGAAPAFSYRPVGSAEKSLHINKEFLFYLRGSLPALKADELAHAAEKRAFILAPHDGLADDELKPLGYTPVTDLVVGKKGPWTLWQPHPPVTQPGDVVASQPAATAPADLAASEPQATRPVQTGASQPTEPPATQATIGSAAAGTAQSGD